jgi:hypothetical protein
MARRGGNRLIGMTNTDRSRYVSKEFDTVRQIQAERQAIGGVRMTAK